MPLPKHNSFVTRAGPGWDLSSRIRVSSSRRAAGNGKARGEGDKLATAMQRLDKTGRRRVGSHCEAKVQDHESIRLVHG